ncbi:bifunctional DNA-formamidopyrimidine glycosylase/DNA-(apurinic or apyrimidinic site) lyase [Patescibacteria group bacterium]|nr:bifunctional DNA-formamidopyrimidine glycosylase/DNA-(apurinic or apyrimidinic site) lyase [Patescibacteria group bacterium]
MPEYPEVYTITNDLKKILVGATIKKIYPQEKYPLLPNSDDFIKNLTQSVVQEVTQIAKNIVIETNKGYLNIHLAMAGQVLVKKTDKPLKWERVGFKIENKGKTFFLSFRDMRMFGKVRFLREEDYTKLKNKHGITPEEKGFTAQKLGEIIRSKDTKIKNLLMEQDKIGGLGNIYATEALFLAGIHPETRTNDLKTPQIELLAKTIKKVIESGIKNRGTTLNDEMFVDIFGKKGKNQTFLCIYNKTSCPNCGSNVETVKISGRNSYFCPNCQPKILKEK